MFWSKKQINKTKRNKVALVLPLIVSILVVTAIAWRQADKPLSNQTSKKIDVSQENIENNLDEYPPGTLRNPLYDPNVTLTPEGKKHYNNEEYGFEFDFPADWTIKQPAFGNTANVFFNLEILPPGQKYY